jgi:hypothetical protein
VRRGLASNRAAAGRWNLVISIDHSSNDPA